MPRCRRLAEVTGGRRAAARHLARAAAHPPTCRAATRARSAATATARASRRSTSRSTVRCRGRTPTSRSRPPCTSAARRDEIAAAENAVRAGCSPASTTRAPRHPYVLAAQPSRARPDPRARGQARAVGVHPRARRLDARRHRARHPPGRAVRARLPRPHPRSSQRTAADRAAYNPTDIGGDITPGALTFVQFVKRPVVSTDAVAHADAGRLPRSSATPPGPGVTACRVVRGAAGAARALRHRVTVRAAGRAARQGVSRPGRQSGGSRCALRATRPARSGVA